MSSPRTARRGPMGVVPGAIRPVAGSGGAKGDSSLTRVDGTRKLWTRAFGRSAAGCWEPEGSG